MKHLFTILLALTCAALHAQTLVLQGTNQTWRGTATAASSEVLTNIVVSGACTPDVRGTFTPLGTYNGKLTWESTNSYVVWWDTTENAYFIAIALENPEPFYISGASPIGTYGPWGTATGTPAAVYSYVTNVFAATWNIKGSTE